MALLADPKTGGDPEFNIQATFPRDAAAKKCDALLFSLRTSPSVLMAAEKST